MTRFVKGQKVKCIDSTHSVSLKINNIYEVIEVRSRDVVIDNTRDGWADRRFKTIIQTIEDVIPGMTLTLKKVNVEDMGFFKSNKFIVDAVKGDRIYIYQEGVGHGCASIDEFEEYEPKKETGNMKAYYKIYECSCCGLQHTTITLPPQQCDSCKSYSTFELIIIQPGYKIMKKEAKEYKVIKPFTLLDIWRAFKDSHSCPEFQEKWEQLLNEMTFANRGLKSEFKEIPTLKKYNALWDNLKHLEAKGFIEETEKDVELLLGMKLYNKDYMTTYTVMADNRLANTETGMYWDMTEEYNTLSELIKRSCSRFEVVDEV